MVVKINVSIPEDLLHRLDQAARQSNTTRSAFLARAVQSCLEEQEEESRRLQRERAAHAIFSLADAIGPWDGAAEIVSWRNRH